MNATTQQKTPVRADRSTLNREAHDITAAQGRGEKKKINIPKEAIENLRRKVRGQIVLPSDPNYDEVREIWNAMIERRPALIARCAEANDVPHAISFARDHGLEISVRGGGHNIAGNALCDNGVTIDFSTMRDVRVDAEKKRAYVEPGATLADFDAAVQAHGLATPVGINSTTGIAGLTLGGGFGWLTRKYGMTVDNLVSADLVTADGKRIRASENENADLFGQFEVAGVISRSLPDSNSNFMRSVLKSWLG